MNKEPYTTPVLVTHELLRDITAGNSGHTGYIGRRPLTQPRDPRL